MEDKDLKGKIKELEHMNYLLKQEIRGLKKELKQARPNFRKKVDNDGDTLIQHYDPFLKQYTWYANFRSNVNGVDNDFTNTLVAKVMKQLEQYDDFTEAFFQAEEIFNDDTSGMVEELDEAFAELGEMHDDTK